MSKSKFIVAVLLFSLLSSNARASRYTWKVSASGKREQKIGDRETKIPLLGGWQCFVGPVKDFPESRDKEEARELMCSKPGAVVKSSLYCRVRGNVMTGNISLLLGISPAGRFDNFVLFCE